MAKRILIVDDDLTFAMYLRVKLEESGYEVDEIHLGREAHDMIVRRKYDLVLMDYHIPDVKGHEVCRHIRQNPDLRRIPIVIMTIFKEKTRDFFKGEGATDVIYKPLDYKSLIEKVKQYIGESDG